MEFHSIISLTVLFVLSFSAASSGAVFRPGNWYARLEKPSWTPPNWAFPLVWTTLFTLMSISAWLVWEDTGLAGWRALLLYIVHLVINAGWSFLFFGRRRLDWAMAEVVLLWLAIAAVIAAFAQINMTAALLLTPYLAWVTLAAALNLRLLQMNGARG